ncbi:hypothetical protein CAPTEDRAFT_210427 [Capitella teleta]|uniref:Uncharacterized protein n=1 Tax=Capitella teleta TaxID=283909 RepID=R7TRR0_CAPTE|nr:hypothetical protein CAPTEDRAFT_210427 [Capitella teleta]|eukprot:ELT96613.1 hypothetical protein CAPTEDRAFT_210427 [Capitella teleta]
MITASKECIPSRSKKKAAGWSTYVSHHQEESIFWHKIWLSSGRPRTGWVQDIRKKTRAQYKRISRWVLRNQGKLSADRMAQALSENNYRDLWREVKKLKGGSYAQPRVVDEVEGAKDVCELFRQKYEDLYSSVSFNEHEMNALLNDVSCNVDVYCKTGKCKNHHVTHVNDVQYAVNKLKPVSICAKLSLTSSSIAACNLKLLAAYLSCDASSLCMLGVPLSSFVQDQWKRSVSDGEAALASAVAELRDVVRGHLSSILSIAEARRLLLKVCLSEV